MGNYEVAVRSYSSSSVYSSPLLDIGLPNHSSATHIQLLPATLRRSSFHLAWGCPTLCLPLIQKKYLNSQPTYMLNVDEATGVRKERSRWRSVVSAYPHGKKAWVYVFIYLNFTVQTQKMTSCQPLTWVRQSPSWNYSRLWRRLVCTLHRSWQAWWSCSLKWTYWLRSQSMKGEYFKLTWLLPWSCYL